MTQTDVESAPEWMTQIPLRADRWRNAHTRSVVARDRNAIVAAGIIWTTSAHDGRYWGEIVVHPDHRRRGIGRAVFDAVSALRHVDLPFITRGYVDDGRMPFARALGARTIQIVPPARVSTGARSALEPQAGVHSADTVGWDELLAANAASYRWTHDGWSPVSDGFESAISEGLTEDLDLEATSVALVNDRVRAVAMVYRDSTPPILTSETVAPETPDGERLIEGCVRRSLEILAARGVAEVEFDGHITDPHFLPVWTRLSPSGRWFHLLEVTPSRPPAR